MSPYLNYDLNFIPQSQPDYIFLEGAGKQRGRFELAFGQIGASAMTGAAVGGINGLYNGLKATTLAGEKGKLRRTQLVFFSLFYFFNMFSLSKNFCSKLYWTCS